MRILSRYVARFALLFTPLLVGAQESSDEHAARIEQERVEAAERAYERQREAAHARMPNTLYASNPTLPDSPHALGDDAEGNNVTKPTPIIARSLRPADEHETAEDVFQAQISQLVQRRCINCHVAGGQYRGGRLVFVRSSTEDHLTQNFQTFKDFLANDDVDANFILGKIRGNNHGGGVQAPANSTNYANMQRFLTLLEGEQDTTPDPITWQTLFDGVAMASDRKVLRRAALIFAGRIPTADEYEKLAERGLRQSIRNLMVGLEFHEFLIRSSNDRLLTDRERRALDRMDVWPFVDYIDMERQRCEAIARNSPREELQRRLHWERAVQFGAIRAPLELIAHVVKNDLPYTEILTADYVMANPQAAQAYGASTMFERENDPFEFKPSKFVNYYLRDGSRQFGEPLADSNCERPITHPGDLRLDFPHAGVLNTPVFMKRYPTTATNRNRARSRWAYYHFLGFDIERSASRTTDPVALADTNNPTFHNPACTVCHNVLDPVAGTFQNYDDVGRYRANNGARDSLDRFYRQDPAGGTASAVDATTQESPTTVSASGFMYEGTREIGIRWDWANQRSDAGLTQVTLKNAEGETLSTYAVSEVEASHCGRAVGDAYRLRPRCVLGIQVTVPTDGTYTVDADAWIWSNNDVASGTLQLFVPGYVYRRGDTWYRDMLTPGIGNRNAPSADNSVQWLAARIIEDDRFAESTVRFWWPALHGSDVLNEPPHSSDANFAARQMAAIAQDDEIKQLASSFRTGFNDGSPYNLKDLLVEMTLSNWFKAQTLPDDDAERVIALTSAGGNRLLAPEELARKTVALTGVQWGRRWLQPIDDMRRPLDALRANYNILYGGIDSDGNTVRARDMTAVMAGVAKSHAAEVSCPIVMRELYLLPDERRLLFEGVDASTSPTMEFSKRFDIAAATFANRETVTLTSALRAGRVSVSMIFTNNHSDADGDRNIRLYTLTLRNANGDVVQSHSLKDLTPPVLNGRVCGQANVSNAATGERDHFNLHSTCGPVTFDLDVPADGNYTFEIVAWADQYGSDSAQLWVSIESDTTDSAGAGAIKAQLARLLNVLLGVEVPASSSEVQRYYDLFVSVWNRTARTGRDRVDSGIECNWRTDQEYMAHFVSDYRVESNGRYSLNQSSVNDFWARQDLSDLSGAGRTWSTVLMAMLMDPRYLHL